MNATVEKIGQMNFTGNIIPANWFKELLFASGKPHVNAILVLSDIVYWYRPVEVRDENTGHFIKFRKKFKADKLQRNYAAFAEQFGISKRQVKEAMDFLEDEKKVITREWRTIDIEAGRLNNVLFIDINVEELQNITYPSTDPLPHSNVRGSSDKKEPLLHSNVGGSCSETQHPPTSDRGTNTEITTKNTTEIKRDDDEDDRGAIAPFPRTLHIGLTELWVHDEMDKLYARYFEAKPNRDQVQFLLRQLTKGITADGIAWAMRETRERGKNWPYCMKVLENYGDIRTAEEAEARKQARNKQTEQEMQAAEEVTATTEGQLEGRDGADKSKKRKAPPPYKKIIDYLNEKTGKSFKHDSKATRDKIRARFNEDFTLEDFYTVIDKKVAQWLTDDKANAWLRPKTLFGTNFESYLNENINIPGSSSLPPTEEKWEEAAEQHITEYDPDADEEYKRLLKGDTD